jgi:hypothetical protein
MIQNIILLSIIIILLFFVSNERKINEIINKKHIKYLFLLIIIYFIYQNYNLVLLIIAVLIFLYFNIDSKERFLNNKYLLKLKESIENFTTEENTIKYKKNINIDINNDINNNNIKNKNENKMNMLGGEGGYDSNNKNNIEPFREDVKKIRDLFENIKMEVKKLT